MENELRTFSTHEEIELSQEEVLSDNWKLAGEVMEAVVCQLCAIRVETKLSME